MSNPFENLKPLDDDYRNRMVQFEIDCNDGLGNAYACHSVAEYRAVVENDHAKAAILLEKNCDGPNKYAASCFKLGRLLLKGRGVPADDKLALKRFQQGCDGGISQGCYFLGQMLMEGTVEKDPARAMLSFQKACTDGETESCFTLGKALLAGTDVPKNPPKAAEVLKAACDSSHAPSCRLLAVLFRNGDTGVPPDAALFEQYKQRTVDLVEQRGALMGMRKN